MGRNFFLVGCAEGMISGRGSGRFYFYLGNKRYKVRVVIRCFRRFFVFRETGIRFGLRGAGLGFRGRG